MLRIRMAAAYYPRRKGEYVFEVGAWKDDTTWRRQQLSERQ